MIARGFGIGMTMMPAMSAAYAALSPADIADATPQLTVLQRVGGSIGTAILTVVLQTGITHGSAGVARADVPAAIASAFSSTYWWVFAVTAVALLPALLLARAESKARGRAGAQSEAAPELAAV
jgi:NADH:ubiquinone oxidoreductase subunit 6 (subunit J)